MSTSTALENVTNDVLYYEQIYKRSPEFCSKLTYRYLLKAGHVPGDTLGWPLLAQGHTLNKLALAR